MTSFFTTFIGKILVTFFISAVPVIELRGSIPFALHELDLAWPIALGVSVIGNMFPVPFILIFLNRIFKWLLNFKLTAPIIKWLEKHAHAKSQSVMKYTAFGLFVLVAIPLPGTGAWTGALVAAVLGMRMKTAIPSIFFGVLAAGIIVTIVSLSAIHIFGIN